MKFYLAKEKAVTLKKSGYEETRENGTVYYYRCSQVNFGIISHTIEDMNKCAQLQTRLRSRKCWGIIFLMVAISDKGDDNDTQLTGLVKLCSWFGKSCLDGIRELSGRDHALSIHLDFVTDKEIINVATRDLGIIRSSQTFCEDTSIQFPPNIFSNWRDPQEWSVKATIIVEIPDAAVTGDYLRSTPNHTLAINRKLLESEIHTDVVIICGNGEKIKAHKCFLTAQSAVFTAMFENDMQEARESQVVISDMTENSVRALLRFLYYGDLKLAEESSLVAFELFNAAHYYDIGLLERILEEVILTGGEGWFEVDVVVRLFLFARNLTPVDEELNAKAISLLKSHSAALKNSLTYNHLLQTDSKTAEEIERIATIL